MCGGSRRARTVHVPANRSWRRAPTVGEERREHPRPARASAARRAARPRRGCCPSAPATRSPSSRWPTVAPMRACPSVACTNERSARRPAPGQARAARRSAPAGSIQAASGEGRDRRGERHRRIEGCGTRADRERCEVVGRGTGGGGGSTWAASSAGGLQPSSTKAGARSHPARSSSPSCTARASDWTGRAAVSQAAVEVERAVEPGERRSVGQDERRRTARTGWIDGRRRDVAARALHPVTLDPWCALSKNTGVGGRAPPPAVIPGRRRGAARAPPPRWRPSRSAGREGRGW